MPIPEDSAPILGAQDLLPADLALLEQVRHRLQDFLAAYGYRAIDVPVLERTDLYLRKLGSQVAALMFTLTDQRGDRLSMRPEFTGSVIRSYIHHEAKLSPPVRWQYCGPVFRDQGLVSGQLRQFTQLGVEFIGSASPRADAELLAVACKGLMALDLPKPRVVLGHAGLVPRLLEGLQLSDRAKLYLTSHLELIREGPGGVAKLRQGLEELLVFPEGRVAGKHELLGEMEPQAASDLMGWLLSEGAAHSTGRRAPEEIARRFQAKLWGADDPTHVERALALAADLASVRAAPAEALASGRAIVQRYSLNPGPLEELEAVVDLLRAFALEDVAVEIDLGLARSLGYYTGIVFELFAGSDRPVGGGGRYNGLVRALGAPQDVPALGFAYTLESLLAALSVAPGQEGAPADAGVLVVPGGEADFGEAVRYMEKLRHQGQASALEVMERSAQERLDYCNAAGIGRIVTVHSGRIEDTPVSKEAVPYASAGAS